MSKDEERLRKGAGGAAAPAFLLPAFLLLALPLALLLALPLPAQGQQTDESRGELDLGQLYRRARTRALGRRLLREGTASLPPVRVHTPRLDSLHAWLAPEAPQREPLAPLPQIRERRLISRLERPAFEHRFAKRHWAYLGTEGRAVLDTMQTRAVRARLQAYFGDPTRTVVDAESLTGRPASDYVQFEYWFVANGTIPIKVVDTGGPFDRGIVFMAPGRFRARLGALRAAFFAPMLRARLRASYVDYYYDPQTETWYRAGFDGRHFFTAPVARSEVLPGRRPVLRRGP